MLSPSSLQEEEEEIELNEASVQKPARAKVRRPAAKEQTKRKLRSDRITGASKPNDAESDSRASSGSLLGALAVPAASDVRSLIVERPELLEAGLQAAHADDDTAPGGGIETEVGTIDLLATDDAGGIVIVMVADADAVKDLVGETLKRVGWVRRHRASKGQEVRAVVLVDRLDDELRYSAAAVAETVQFKTYRMSLSFEDVEV